ncbi:hypothetical protein [Pseudomonas sp. CAM1A]|uniref:hypothetical protein n=1 Tax=Pseudomonas sp. CAM1A TaxID=3231717 RepID=UPI0039C60C87
MNIVQRLALTYPLMTLQVPGGWNLVKNNIIDADPGVLEDIENPLEQMLARENFFAADVFYALCEHSVDERRQIKSVIDVWCRPSEENESLIGYELTLSLYKNKSKISFFSKEYLASDRYAVVQVLSQWMCSFSLEFVYALDSGSLVDPNQYFLIDSNGS